MKIFNENLDRITILHMPGKGTVDKFKPIIESQKNNLIIKDDDISIIVIATKNYVKNSPVIHQLTFNNIRYYNGAEKVDESEWNNALKIKYILNNLKKIKTKYTLMLDARDTLICDNLTKTFIQKFNRLNSKLVFNASVYRHPSYIKVKGMDDKYKPSLDSKPFLNCGVCFGETATMFDIYSASENLHNKYNYLLKDEQMWIKAAIANEKLLKLVSIDSQDTLFKCVHQSDNKPDFAVIRESDNYIIKNILSKDYKGRRFKKKLKIKLDKAKLILYPNYKNHEADAQEFYAKYKEGEVINAKK